MAPPQMPHSYMHPGDIRNNNPMMMSNSLPPGMPMPPFPPGPMPPGFGMPNPFATMGPPPAMPPHLINPLMNPGPPVISAPPSKIEPNSALGIEEPALVSFWHNVWQIIW